MYTANAEMKKGDVKNKVVVEEKVFTLDEEQRESAKLDILSGGFAFDKAVSKSKDSEPFNGQNRSFTYLKG